MSRSGRSGVAACVAALTALLEAGDAAVVRGQLLQRSFAFGRHTGLGLFQAKALKAAQLVRIAIVHATKNGRTTLKVKPSGLWIILQYCVPGRPWSNNSRVADVHCFTQCRCRRLLRPSCWGISGAQ